MNAGRSTYGVVEGDRLFDAGAVLSQRYPTLRDALAAQALEEVREAAGSTKATSFRQAKLLPVIPNPSKIFCIGLNYEAHRVEAKFEKTGHPTVFTRFADSQLAHRENILLPRVSAHLDYECELAVIIGKEGRYISEADAMAHVAGYACYNDGSIRDWQNHTGQFTPGKNFPKTGGFGPWMVTADEVPDVSALRICTRVNGETLQEAGLDQLIFSIPRLIAYLSGFTPLAPGDVIATGTPGGVGFKRTPPIYLKPGDTVEVEITGVGLLENGVAQE